MKLRTILLSFLSLAALLTLAACEDSYYPYRSYGYGPARYSTAPAQRYGYNPALDSGRPYVSNTIGGALIGGAVGAGAGALIGSAAGRPGTGAAIGGGVGLVGGAVIGSSMDREQAQRDRESRNAYFEDRPRYTSYYDSYDRNYNTRDQYSDPYYAPQYSDSYYAPQYSSPYYAPAPVDRSSYYESYDLY